MRRTVLALLAPFLLIGFALLGWELSRSRTVQLFGELVSRIETDRPVVALTFDDGPTRDGVRAVLSVLDSLIEASGQAGEIFFRPPLSKKLLVLPWVLERSGGTSVTWDVEPESPTGAWRDAGEILRHPLENTRPGSIILLHVMYSSRSASRAALPEIITELRGRGFDFVTLQELIRGPDSGSEGRPE